MLSFPFATSSRFFDLCFLEREKNRIKGEQPEQQL